MKKLILSIIFATTLLVGVNANGLDLLKKSTSKWPTQENSLRGASVLVTMDEAFYDSIALPYNAISLFDTLATASIVTIPFFGDYPAIGFKITLAEKKPIGLSLQSDSLNMYGFSISSNVDQSSPVYFNLSSGSTDSIDAGVYYIALFSNYQCGPINLTITEDSIPTQIPVFTDIAFPSETMNLSFTPMNTTNIDIVGGGTFPAVGYKFTVPNDTTVSLFLESNDIGMYVCILSPMMPTVYDETYVNTYYSSGLFPSIPAGTYYLTIISLYEYGNYNLYVHEGEYDYINYASTTLPFSVTDAVIDNTTGVINEFNLNPSRGLGYTFTLAQDTTIIFAAGSSDMTSYEFTLYDNAMSVIQTLTANDTIDLVAGSYFVSLNSYNGYGHYDLSIAYEEGLPTNIANASSNLGSVKVIGNKLVVSSTEEGAGVNVYSIEGINVATGEIQTGSFECIVPTSGIYIVSSNGNTKKVLVP